MGPSLAEEYVAESGPVVGTVTSDKYTGPAAGIEQKERANTVVEPLLAEKYMVHLDPVADIATSKKCDEPVASIAQTEGNTMEPLLAEVAMAQSDVVADTTTANKFADPVVTKYADRGSDCGAITGRSIQSRIRPRGWQCYTGRGSRTSARYRTDEGRGMGSFLAER